MKNIALSKYLLVLTLSLLAISYKKTSSELPDDDKKEEQVEQSPVNI